ncbi:ABC transporter substrate-binding protein [Microbacterium sp.]|uniref:ABC transporter substrate-binding protein n=1 Tax=Microbacterium sp. TaxID=51671 RepID=UPI0039E48312
MKKKTLAATLAALAAVGLLLSGCTGDSGTGDSTDAPAEAVTDLKIGNFLDVTSWDPSLADIGFDGPYLSAVYDALIALDKDGNPIPSFATDWTVADDDLSITLDLKTGVTFSDGSDVDADAVVKSLEYLQQGARSGEAYTHVASFEKVDDDSVKINLTERDDTILYFMGLGRSYIMSPAAIDAGTLAAEPVGSGPYTLDTATSVAGAEYHFTKVADYWDAASYPFTSLAIFPILDATARHNAMLSGQINVNYGDEANLDQAEEQGWNVAQRVSGWVGLQFTDHTGAKLEALGKVEVRQALNYAFDGAGVLAAVGGGAGVATNQVFPDGGDVNDPSLNDTYAYDVAKAKELLASAGESDLALTMPMSPIFAQWQPAAEQAFKDAGITVTWDDMQQPDYQLNAASYPVFIAFLAMDGNALATVARQVTSVQWFNPEPDYTKVPEVTSIVDTINSTRGDEQLAAVKDLNKKLTELAWWSVWYQADNTYYSVKGVQVQPVIGMMFPTLRYITQG